MEIECDFDWEKLTGILDKAPIESEYIEYKGIKYIKEQYCVPKSKIKEKIEKLDKKILEYETYREKGKETDVEYYDFIANSARKKILQELMEDK